MTSTNGARAIGSLAVSDTVLAYNPTTDESEPETVQHVWVNHDSDLVDVRLNTATTTTAATAATTPHATAQVSGHGWLVESGTGTSAIHLATTQANNSHTTTTATNETIHTTANHPWLTADRDWVPAGELRSGEHLVSLSSGSSDTVAWVQVVPGQADMYNLTVATDHTYAVGMSHTVVHNTDGQCTEPSPADRVRAKLAEMQGAMTKDELGRTTYGVAHVTTADGVDEIRVSQAGKLGWVRPGLRGDATNVRAPVDSILPHINDAEQHLWRAAEARGATINALGATRPVCLWCQERLPDSIPIVTPLKS